MRGSSLKETLYNFSFLVRTRAVEVSHGFFFAVAEMPVPKEFFVIFWYHVVAVIFPIEISARKLYAVTPFSKNVINNLLDFFGIFSVISFHRSSSFREWERCGNIQSLLGRLL